MTRIAIRSIRSILRALSSLILLAAVLAGFGAHFWYWQQIDANGRIITCTVADKRERIHHRSRTDSWNPVFHVSLACAWPDGGAPLSQPEFDTDEAEYDRIGPGSPFEVRYLSDVPQLLILIGINGAHLARDTAAVHAGRTLMALTPLLALVGFMLLVWFLAWLLMKRNMRGARWIIFGLLGAGFMYLLTPTLPVTLSGTTARATATVKDLQAFKRLLNSNKSRGFDASMPYQLVVLEFTPAGRREPVLAGDMIDIASHPDLAVGQLVAIDYEVEHPRRANITGATRTYYFENVRGAIIAGFATIALFVGITLAWEAIKRRGKQALDEAKERARDRAL